jgi:uncharacterized protein YjbI with pentapeptide repeats
MKDWKNAIIKDKYWPNNFAPKGLDATNAMLENLTFAGPKLDGAKFNNATLKNIKFAAGGKAITKPWESDNYYRLSLQNADFTGTVLEDVIFDGVDLSYASFKGATLKNVVFTRYNSYDNTSLKYADFSDANLENVKFRGGGCHRYLTSCIEANFTGATFKNVNFDDTYLDCASFKKAKMNNVSFKSAQLVETKFSGAILENVSFEYALLSKVSLKTVKINNVNFQSTRLWGGVKVNSAGLAELLKRSYPGRPWRGRPVYELLDQPELKDNLTEIIYDYNYRGDFCGEDYFARMLISYLFSQTIADEKVYLGAKEILRSEGLID